MSPQAVTTELRLASVLLALWPWVILDDPTMTAVLELLCVYTANNTAGQSDGKKERQQERERG